jgi:translocation and assembly module TamA
MKKCFGRMLICICVFLVTLFGGSLQAAPLVDVTINGVSGTLLDNIKAVLTIYQKRDQANLSEWRIRRMHADAQGEIKKALEPFGYYQPEVSTELLEIGELWHAIYTIIPGTPITISAVDIQIYNQEDGGQEVEEAMTAFPLQQGMILEHELYKEGKKNLLGRLAALGYIDAAYQKSEIRVTLAENDATIDMQIKLGPRYLFGDTQFDQQLLAPEFLVGYLNFSKGDIYSPKKLAELQRSLYRTNYFGRVVVQGEVDNKDGLYIPITVKMEDPEFFDRYTLGLGYATDEGVRGRIGWENRLFNRYGHNVAVELKLAERETGVDFIYGVPVNNPRFDKVLFGTQYNKESWEDTDTRIFQGSTAYQHKDRRFTYGGGLQLHDEKYEVGSTAGDKFLTVPFLIWSLVYADDPIDTTNGLFFSVKLQGASETVFSDSTFAQSIVSGKIITTPFDGLRLISRFSIGATAVDSVDDLPPSFRFYAGGDKSVRGFSYRELGSRDSSGTIIGGKYLLFGSLELEKSVYENWSVAAFVDTGKGVNDISEELGKGVGGGIRYRLPFGQIRLDVASAVSEEDNPLRIHLTVGGDL